MDDAFGRLSTILDKAATTQPHTYIVYICTCYIYDTYHVYIIHICTGISPSLRYTYAVHSPLPSLLNNTLRPRLSVRRAQQHPPLGLPRGQRRPHPGPPLRCIICPPFPCTAPTPRATPQVRPSCTCPPPSSCPPFTCTVQAAPCAYTHMLIARG